MRAISQIPVSFLFQSYFDSTDEKNALLVQATNDMIVASTKKASQGRGYAVGVAGFSDTPVAFRFNGSERESSVLFCRPGQVLRPGRFDSFEYGLPFGWLGGGHALIYVAHEEDVALDLGATKQEIIFHRTRVQIEASAADLPALKRNWPLHFPWTRAARGTAPSDQSGSPIIRVYPTRALMRLRSEIVVNKVVQLVFRGSREFDEASDGTFTLTDATTTFVEVSFAASTDPTTAPALFPTATIPEDFLHLACDEGGLTLLGLGDAALTAVEVDIVRFGRI